MISLLSQLSAANPIPVDERRDHPTPETMDAVLAYLSDRGILSRDICTASGISITQVRNALALHVKEGRARRGEVLKARGAYEYFLAQL